MYLGINSVSEDVNKRNNITKASVLFRTLVTKPVDE
jgi:hypothetical protein